MFNCSTELPQPDLDARQHSQQLVDAIKAEIANHGGQITFQRYMQMALYQPGLGYYTAGAAKFGVAGDFITAPEVSPLYSRCLAIQCQQVITALGEDAVILELGAGSGQLAVEMLRELDHSQALPATYLILEPSPSLQLQQQANIQREIPHLASRVMWLESLPTDSLRGVIIANEVLDAMPVQQFVVDKAGIYEQMVVCGKDGLQLQPAEQTIEHTELTPLLDDDIPKPYITEFNPVIPAWIKSVSECLLEGIMLLVDYGFPRREFYHPDRTMGTLVCHYRHYIHGDVFYFPGLQDISAHVDFTQVAQAGIAAGMTLAGYIPQANFLVNLGLLQIAQTDDVELQYEHAQQIKMLTLPSEMGELFKVIAFSKKFDEALIGFQEYDRRGSL